MLTNDLVFVRNHHAINWIEPSVLFPCRFGYNRTRKRVLISATLVQWWIAACVLLGKPQITMEFRHEKSLCVLFTLQMPTLLVVPYDASVDGWGGSELKLSLCCCWISDPDFWVAGADRAISIQGKTGWILSSFCRGWSSDQVNCGSMHIYTETRKDGGINSGIFNWSLHGSTKKKKWRQTPQVDPRVKGPVVTSWTVSSDPESWSKSDYCLLTALRQRRPATRERRRFRNYVTSIQHFH